MPTRWIAEQHVQEDLGFIPTLADWLVKIQPEAWMGRGAPKHIKEIEREERDLEGEVDEGEVDEGEVDEGEVDAAQG